MAAKVNQDECTGCGSCVEECPVEAITLDDEAGVAVIDADECVDCGVCIDACPSEAIEAE